MKNVLFLGAILCAASVLAAEDSSDNVGDVRLKGCLGTRLDAMVERHVVGTDVDYITAAYQEKTETKGWWQTEFWGKWMHSAVPYIAYTKSAKLQASVDHGIDRMIGSQEANGYIGNYPDELRCGEGWDVWGMKYTMMGLLHYYDGRVRTPGELRRDRSSRPTAEDALNACKKLCDYVIAEIGPNGKRGRELWQTGNWSGYASSSILEPVMWLYKRTNDKKYLDFATFIVKGMTEPEAGPRLLDLALKGISVADRNVDGQDLIKNDDWAYVCKRGRSKAYEMMSCYQGMLDYVEVMREEGMGKREEIENLQKAAVLTAEDIVKEEVNLAGGCASSEAWYHGARKQHLPYLRLQETCVTTTWMRFCEKLLDVTDDPKWADQIERTFYNAYLGAMKADGAEFAGYTPLSGNRYHGQHHCFMHTDCCTANGPRGFLCFLRKLFHRAGDTATFNFYASALVPGFDMYALYPRTDSARIVSHTTGKLKLRLRIPSWSAKTEVKLNGKAFADVKAGTYFTIDHDWALGDIVEIKFDMPVVQHVLDHHVAFTRGPVLLARDRRFNDGDLTEPLRSCVGDVVHGGASDGQVMTTFTSVRTPSEQFWMTFSATLPLGPHHANPEGANPATVFFCDYASAGNLWRRENYYRTWFPVEIPPESR